MPNGLVRRASGAGRCDRASIIIYFGIRKIRARSKPLCIASTMLTPRHGMAAAVLADGIHVAGGGPMNGGAYQSSVHEVFAD